MTSHNCNRLSVRVLAAHAEPSKPNNHRTPGDRLGDRLSIMWESKSSVTSDMVVANMAAKQYDVALVLLSQMEIEDNVLSEMNALRLCQCLYFRYRYMSALERTTKYIEDGNYLPEMLFLKGMCHYRMGQFILAHGVFSVKPEWRRWALKAELKKDRVCIVLGRKPTYERDLAAELAFTDAKSTITVVLTAENVKKDLLLVGVNPYWLEICYNEPHRQIVRYAELHDRVKPDSVAVTVTDTAVTVVLEKEAPAPWPRLAIAPTAVDMNTLLTGSGMELTDTEACDSYDAVCKVRSEVAPDFYGSWSSYHV